MQFACIKGSRGGEETGDKQPRKNSEASAVLMTEEKPWGGKVAKPGNAHEEADWKGANINL